MSSACVACSRTASELAPAGGMTTAWRIFSEPALMNWVGRLPTSESEAMNSAAEMPRTAHFVQRLRSAREMAGT